MRLLIHHPRLSYYIGGGETVPLAQASLLTKMGHEIEILTADTPNISPIFSDFVKNNPGIRIHLLKLWNPHRDIYSEQPGRSWSRWDKESIYFGQASSEFYSKIGKKYDLVVTHLLSDSLFVPLRFINVLHLHGVPVRSREFDEIFLSRPNALVAVSDYVKRGWERLYGKVIHQSINVCHNGISLKAYPNLRLRRENDLLFVGRLIKTKGLYNLLDAALTLNHKLKFNKLTIVGEGPELNQLKNKARLSKLKNKIFFKNHVEPKELIHLYNTSKVFVCPSYVKEGVLSTMLEAASCGMTVVTTNCCGMVEFAKHEWNSLLANPQDPVSLSKMLARALMDDDLRSRLCANAWSDLKNKWEIQMTTKKLEGLYLSALKEPINT